jgi:hypothetical protein
MVSWTLGCSTLGSCGVISALFLSSNGYFPATGLLCISLNLGGGGLLTAGSAGNAVESSEFIPFIVLNAVFSLVACVALGRRAAGRSSGGPAAATLPPSSPAPSFDNNNGTNVSLLK